MEHSNADIISAIMPVMIIGFFSVLFAIFILYLTLENKIYRNQWKMEDRIKNSQWEIERKILDSKYDVIDRVSK